MQRDESADPTGSAAEEAVRLVGALRDLVSGPAAEHLATGAAECQVCPFCRLVALLREADPQTVGRAAEGVVSMVAAAAALAEPFLRSMVDTAVSAAQGAAGEAYQAYQASDAHQAPESRERGQDRADDDRADDDRPDEGPERRAADG